MPPSHTEASNQSAPAGHSSEAAGDAPRDRSSHDTRDGLVGRAEESELISSFLDRAALAGSALLLVGEPGMGKSALLDSAADAATAAGTRVLRAEGVEFEADVAFSGLNQLLVPLLGQLDGLAEPHRDALTSALCLGDGHGPTPGRVVVSNAALGLVWQAAEACPVLLVVDDLQWLDRSSADVLSFVARRLSGSRVGFLAAGRSEEEGFFDPAGVPTHELGPLDDASASDLLQARFPTLAPRVRTRLLAEAQGNPLALLELPVASNGWRGIVPPALPRVLPLTHRVQNLFGARRGPATATRTLLVLAVYDGTASSVSCDPPRGRGPAGTRPGGAAGRCRSTKPPIGSCSVTRSSALGSWRLDRATSDAEPTSRWRRRLSSSPSVVRGTSPRRPRSQTKSSPRCSRRSPTGRCDRVMPSVRSPPWDGRPS